MNKPAHRSPTDPPPVFRLSAVRFLCRFPATETKIAAAAMIDRSIDRMEQRVLQRDGGGRIAF